MTKSSRGCKDYSCEELVAMIQRGGRDREKAITCIYEEMLTNKMIHRYILQNSGTEMDAEDVLNEAIIIFIRNVEDNKFRGDASCPTYITAIAKLYWLNVLGKRKNEKDKEERVLEMSEFYDAKESFSMESRERLKRCMAKLNEKCQKILTWRRGNPPVPWAEIAEMLGFKTAQVAQNTGNRCFKELLKHYRKDCLAKLSEKCKKIFLLRQESPPVSWAEIANILGYESGPIAEAAGKRCLRDLDDCYNDN